MRGWCNALGLLLGVHLAVSSAGAQEEAPETQPANEEAPTTPPTVSGGVAFDAVDAATVRIFGVGNVKQISARGRNRSRLLGIPEAGHGTGVVVDPRGVVATAKHVVEGMGHIAVRLPGPDGSIVPAVVAYVDDQYDFALLLAGVTERLPNVLPLPEQPRVLNVRETVDAVGYPLDPDRDQPQSSRGIISGSMDDGHLQLDISVNPGNSGGPLLATDGSLVGLVVARGSLEAGVQGIGIAVPIAPVREAYDRIRRDGTLSDAFGTLRRDHSSSRAAARVVDGIVRLGGAELLREATALAESDAVSERITLFRELAQETEDADLLTLIAAYFWDAAQILLEIHGGGSEPRFMNAGPARDRASQLWNDALALALRAVRADPSVAERSPFIGELARRERRRRRARTASAEAPTERLAPETSPVVREPYYRPYILVGFGVAWGPEPGIVRQKGPAFQVTALFPFSRIDDAQAFRWSPVLGASVVPMEIGGGGGWFAGAELGMALRIGHRPGVAIHGTWAPGAYGVPPNRSECFEEDAECVAIRAASLRSFHFGALLKMSGFHFGVAVRVIAPSNNRSTASRVVTMTPVIGGSF